MQVIKRFLNNCKAAKYRYLQSFAGAGTGTSIKTCEDLVGTVPCTDNRCYFSSYAKTKNAFREKFVCCLKLFHLRH
jgi:hypothetical protein